MGRPGSVDHHYDPGSDAATRFPEWVIRHRSIAPLSEVMCLRRRVILLERDFDRATRRCALAHALAHIDLGHLPGSRPEAVMEREADVLAARRLISMDRLEDVARWAFSDVEAAHELDVTVGMLRVRCSRLHPSERARLMAMIREVHHP